MRVFYENTDITDMVQVKKCIVRDTCGCRCDSLDVEFENAAGWYRWGPREDDVITVTHNGYEAGTMYVNTIRPENGRFRIFATSLPCRARRKGYRSFVGKSIEEIIRGCAVETGMDYRLYGVEGNITIPYLQREDESCAAFLSRLLELEGAILKSVNGRYAAIGIAYAQDREAKRTAELAADQTGARYTRSGTTYKALTIKTPYAEATARDTAVDGRHMHLTLSRYPAMDNAQAGRWARGKLLALNRTCETVTLQSGFDAGKTALERINITGGTDMDGEWIAGEVEHDLVNMTTAARMNRCIRTVQ